MSAAISPSDPALSARALRPALERARGKASLVVAAVDGRNRIADLAQSGAARLLFPGIAAGAPLEAVVVNTAGGLTGGDRFRVSIRAEAGAAVVATTQAGEKVYRSLGPAAAVTTRLAVEPRAALHWLPQETILFEGSRIRRSLDVAIAADAALLAAEMVVLGRGAMGERLSTGTFLDSWRIRRGGRLVFAEETRLAGNLRAEIARPATLNGATSFATVLMVAPSAPDRLAELRALLDRSDVEAGASAFDGLLVCRLVAVEARTLRSTLVSIIALLGGRAPPRVWST